MLLHCWHMNSQLTHQRRFALLSNLDKNINNWQKNTPGSKQIFGNYQPKKIQGFNKKETIF